MTTTLTPWRLLFLLLFLAARLGAADETLQLKFPQLELTDGRKLKDVAVKSYDAGTGKLLLLTEGKAMTILLDLVPPPWHDKLKDGAPKSGSTTSATPKSPDYSGTPKPSNSAVAGRRAPGDSEQSEAQQIARHREAALERARNYYRYEFQAGSSAIRVNGLSFETEDTVAVSGWTGRYRTEGRVLLQYFDSAGYSYSRATDRFEITTEQKPGASIKVVDFTRK